MAQSKTTENPRDKRAEFESSDANLVTVARIAQRLRESDVFHSMMASAARRSIEAHLVSSDDLETESIDAAAVDVLAEAAANTSTDGLYLLRNQIVTNEEAGIQLGDRIHMESARDRETVITYRVVTARAAATEFEAARVTDDNDRPRQATADFGAGQVMLSERFDIEPVPCERATVTGETN